MMLYRPLQLIALIGFGLLIVDRASGSGPGVLRIYNWSDYTSPQLVAKFEKETGIKVSIDTFDSNETLLSKLKAGGASGYDITMPTNDMVPILIQQNLLESIDAPTLAGYQNIEARWQSPAWDSKEALIYR